MTTLGSGEGRGLTTIHSDALVLGSSLGGLVAATYLARAGLRVTLLEEEALSKRPPLLRDPLVLTGLEAGGPVQRVLRELALPLIEQRKLGRDPVALQVVLPGARVDVCGGRARLAQELEAFGLGHAAAIEAWLERVDDAGSHARERLWEQPRSSGGSGWRRWVERRPGESALQAALPPIPERLEPFVAGLLASLASGLDARSGQAPALLLHSLREGGFRMPDAGELFSDLLRQRLLALHGEIRQIGGFGLLTERGEVGLELARGRLFGRALVVAAPRELVARASETPAPRWLRGGPPPASLPPRLFRAERKSLPIGLGRRVVVAPPDPEQLHWISRHSDPEQQDVDWLAISGPGARSLPADNPLGELNPFPGEGIVSVDCGAEASWDRDASDLRFPQLRLPSLVRTRPAVIAVGPEVEPGLGFEGEILRARAAALWLVERLTPRRGLGGGIR